MVVPTHVGVNRTAGTCRPPRSRRPHARGGEPSALPSIGRWEKSSPRTWVLSDNYISPSTTTRSPHRSLFVVFAEADTRNQRAHLATRAQPSYARRVRRSEGSAPYDLRPSPRTTPSGPGGLTYRFTPRAFESRSSSVGDPIGRAPHRPPGTPGPLPSKPHIFRDFHLPGTRREHPGTFREHPGTSW